MRVGTIGQFLTDEEIFVKGQLIRLGNDFEEDFHIANSLYEEINNGLFMCVNGSKEYREAEENI